LQVAAAAASQASAAALKGLNSKLHAVELEANIAKRQKTEDGDMYNKRIENLSQQNTSLAGEAANTRPAKFEAALEKSCSNLHNMQLTVLLNNIRNVVVNLNSPQARCRIMSARETEVKS